MCGIVGMKRFDGTSADEAVVRDMATTLRHRGPDGSGFWFAGSTAFGHTRLSIIDVAGSTQPMSTPDKRFTLAFNGEIFNYRQLRRTLNYRFVTRGDTEVLLAGLATRGTGFVSELEGQFAFALHDACDDSLLLCRDRLGVLPLYYFRSDSSMVFGSEIKSLFPALPRGAEIDADSLDAYLAHRSVPAPFTLFQGVRKVLAGSFLRISAKGVAEEFRYWAPPTAERPIDIDDRSAVERVNSALTSAVDAALVADVPVGAYLSGGLDSSLIAALGVQARRGEGIDTFSAGFGDPRFDELPYARQVSKHLGTRHHEVNVTPLDFQDLWRRLTWHRDAPLSEPADVAVYGLARLASEQVKVVLSGEGSDELFAGYPKYRAAKFVEMCDVLPAIMRRGISDALDERLPARWAKARIPLRAMAATGQADRFRSWFAPFTPQERATLLGRAGVPGRFPPPGGHRDLLTRMLETDCSVWLSDNLLERGDRMSMAASIELRPPFLDHHVVELAFALPSRVKLHHGESKWVIKEIARRHLPKSIVDRTKSGFRVPLDTWFRGDLAGMAFERLTSSDSFVGTTMDVRFIRRMLHRHRQGRSSEEIRIWTLLCLEIWYEVFFTTSLDGRLAWHERQGLGR